MIVGVDGCRGGWIAIRENGDVTLADSFQAVHAACPCERIYVDIPMGLLNEQSRDLEAAARSLLFNRRSSIFPVPCREAVYATDYAAACEINHGHTGRKISRQTWHICSKILEVDTVLNENPMLSRRVFESHPELAFQCFKGAGLEHSKKTEEGLSERLALLRPILPQADEWYAKALDSFPRKYLARDDIVDALVLIAVGKSSPREVTGSGALEDERGVPIRMMIPGSNRA